MSRLAGKTHPHRTARVIELVGTSTKSFEDAIQSAILDAGKTLRDLHGAHVISQNVKLDNGKIMEYRVGLKLSFGIERT